MKSGKEIKESLQFNLICWISKRRALSIQKRIKRFKKKENQKGISCKFNACLIYVDSIYQGKKTILFSVPLKKEKYAANFFFRIKIKFQPSWTKSRKIVFTKNKIE